MGGMGHQDCFKAVEALVQTWRTGEYMYHIQLIKDRGAAGVDFGVIFSIPKKARPIAPHTALVSVTVVPEGKSASGESPRILFSLEGQRQQLESGVGFRLSWLDNIMRRKQVVADASLLFAQEGSLPQPRAFMPGENKAAEVLAVIATDALEDNIMRVEDAVADVEEALDGAVANGDESAEALEALLVSVFSEADADGNGVLDPAEFLALLTTANLDLDPVEQRQLLAMADANGDGVINYAEFAPLGADIIQTMRMRRLHEDMEALREEEAELTARATVHGMGEKQITDVLIGAFKEYDADGNGTLDAGEMKACLEGLELGPQAVSLTPREVRTIMAMVDVDGNGLIEYNEFAPLMFNWLVEVFKLGFMQPQLGELEAYLVQHLASYDLEKTGRLSRGTAKRALAEADLLQPRLTPVQVHALLADADFDEEERVEYGAFVARASPLVRAMCDPRLERKRVEVAKRAAIFTPLQALTDEEKAHFLRMVAGVFEQYDADGSGTLEFGEFRKCLAEARLGLSEKQISYLMSVADANEDGVVDYGEFHGLFFGCLVELGRMETIEATLQGEAAEATAALLLGQLLIPVSILFDLACGGKEHTSGPAFAEQLAVKADEWGVASGIGPVMAGVALEEELTWAKLTAVFAAIAPPAAPPPGEVAPSPTGEGGGGAPAPSP